MKASKQLGRFTLGMSIQRWDNSEFGIDYTSYKFLPIRHLTFWVGHIEVDFRVTF